MATREDLHRQGEAMRMRLFGMQPNALDDTSGLQDFLSETEFGWALSAFALGYALFQTPSGMLADRYGPRAVLAAVAPERMR